MTTATQLPTIRELVLKSSAPNVTEWHPLDDSDLAEYLDIPAEDRIEDRYVDPITLDAMSAMRDLLAAGYEVSYARDDDGWWFARPDTETVYRDAPTTVSVSREDDPMRDRYTVAEQFECNDCGATVAVEGSINETGTATRHPSGEWHIPCPRCGTVWVAKEEGDE